MGQPEKRTVSDIHRDRMRRRNLFEISDHIVKCIQHGLQRILEVRGVSNMRVIALLVDRDDGVVVLKLGRNDAASSQVSLHLGRDDGITHGFTPIDVIISVEVANVETMRQKGALKGIEAAAWVFKGEVDELLHHVLQSDKELGIKLPIELSTAKK